MTIHRSAGETLLRLPDHERKLLVWALRRASFEDTPPEHQREILDFAYLLLAELGEDS